MIVILRAEAVLATRSLTHKQVAVLEFIRRYLMDHQRSPLIREIQTGCRIASYKSVVDRLSALEHKGYIARVPNKHRGIRFLERAMDRGPALAPQPSEMSAVHALVGTAASEKS